MFQWTVCHASPLYTWVESAMCVWVGSGVSDYWGAVETCTRFTEREIVSKISVLCSPFTHTYTHTQPLTLVPSGQEPDKLLSFFKGTMVVHSSPHPSPHPSPVITPHRITPSQEQQATRLYQVSGSSLEHIKAIEVHTHMRTKF